MVEVDGLGRQLVPLEGSATAEMENTESIEEGQMDIYDTPDWFGDYEFIEADTQEGLLHEWKAENAALRAERAAGKSSRWEIVSVTRDGDGYEALLRREVYRMPD